MTGRQDPPRPPMWRLNNLGWAMLIVIGIGATVLAPYWLRWHPAYGAIQHRIGDTTTLTVDGSKRSIISKNGNTCAEPSPDAMSTIAVNLAAELTGRAGGQEAGANLEALSNPEVQALFRRTQGIQAIRDGMFRLCEAQMNAAIAEEFYEEQMTDLLVTLNYIVPLELCINASTKLLPAMERLMAADEGDATSDLINTYMGYCLDTSKEYGLVMARNASERRQDRRGWDRELELERLRVEAFRTERSLIAAPAPSAPRE